MKRSFLLHRILLFYTHQHFIIVKTSQISADTAYDKFFRQNPKLSNCLHFASYLFTNNISSQIETARKKLEISVNFIQIGETLYNNTKDDLEQLKIVVGEQDFNYTNIADKVAKEMLNCAINCFNKGVDSAEKHKEIMALCEKGKTLVIGNIEKQRYEDELKVMQNPDILEKYKVLNELNYISDRAQNITNYHQIIDFISDIKPYLEKIGEKIGESNFYINTSSDIAQFASSVVINDWNIMVKDVNSYKQEIKNAWKAFKEIEKLDMNQNTLITYQKNKNIMQETINSINKGCYKIIIWSIAILVFLYFISHL